MTAAAIFTASCISQKNPEELHSEFIDACLGAPTPISFKSQKEAFQEILTDTLGEECNYETVRQIHENLTELAEEHKEDEVPLTLTKPEVKDLLEKSGVEPERLEHFDKVYEEAAGEKYRDPCPGHHRNRKVCREDTGRRHQGQSGIG